MPLAIFVALFNYKISSAYSKGAHRAQAASSDVLDITLMDASLRATDATHLHQIFHGV